MNAAEAIQVLEAARAVLDKEKFHLSVGSVAVRLDFSKQYVREHIDIFPNRWRAPGGEWRIPVADVDALAKKSKALNQRAAGPL